ncbi:IS66 family insertion sequence element accessory protein TnpB [Candidatus Rickettsia colombianensi]|uniref:IS66 family insertion sequence element accessory protein TnpB n=1 Tax=Candidatus Rickettsia colombianensi TaxID=1090944 RepID=UPI0039777E3D
MYLCTGYTDMRKGINGLSLLGAQSILSDQFDKSVLFVFRDKKADRIQMWNGQGFCLY